MVHILWWVLHKHVCGNLTQQCLHKCRGLAYCSRQGRSLPQLRCPPRETSDHTTPPFAGGPPRTLPGGLPLLVPATCPAPLAPRHQHLLCPVAAQTLVEVLPVAHPQPSSWLLPVPACRAAHASLGGPAPQHLNIAAGSSAQLDGIRAGTQSCNKHRQDTALASSGRPHTLKTKQTVRYLPRSGACAAAECSR
jgi:hypothetical protein